MLQKYRLPILIALALLALSGCSSVSVINESDIPITIMVKLPDKKSIVTQTLAGQSTANFSSESGGPYNVRVFALDAYNEKIKEIGNAYSPLFDTASSDDGGLKQTRPWQASWKFTNQQTGDEPVKEFPEEASCYGNVGENAEVSATITWHDQAGVWVAECTSAEGDGIDWSAIFSFLKTDAPLN